MGALIEGRWVADDSALRQGRFHRAESAFRDRVAAGGPHPPAAGRYHLYVSLSCPWASRVVIVRRLKRLEEAIPMTVVHPDMLEEGWTFRGEREPVNGFRRLYEVYQAARPDFTGRVTVPVLWDCVAGTIVNNESAEIMRMLNRDFDASGDPAIDLCPPDLEEEIDALNARIYEAVNNGVYRAGFARDQSAYNEAVTALFATLDELEERLSTRRTLVGGRFTEADIRLFTTAVRFDLVYYGHFKCNLRQWRDYPNLLGWLRDVYQRPGIAETVDLEQIKRHYYGSQLWVNPSGIVPIGPSVDLTAPHGRDGLA